MAKIKDSNMIFVEKPTFVDKRKKNDKSGANQSIDHNEIDVKFAGGADQEAVQLSRMDEKRIRNTFKKIYHLNTQRMLRILGYTPTQADERKFLYSNYKQKLERELKGE